LINDGINPAQPVDASIHSIGKALIPPTRKFSYFLIPPLLYVCGLKKRKNVRDASPQFKTNNTPAAEFFRSGYPFLALAVG